MKSLKDRLMKYLPTFSEFEEAEKKNKAENAKLRNQELAGLKNTALPERYCIMITVEDEGAEEWLFEHEQYKKFKKSNNRYFKHPENPSIPVKAHYHVVGGKSKEEVYAVNMDGTAHHRSNRGYQVPEKEARELAAHGVKFKEGNVLESIEESAVPDIVATFYFYIEG